MKYNLELIKNKRKIIGFSTVLILLSLLGILYSTFNTSYKKPINLGMDFVGGNELRIERICNEECSNFSPDSVLENLKEKSKNKTKQLSRVVIWPSTIDVLALWKPLSIDLVRVLPSDNSSLILSNISIFASTAIPMLSISPDIPGKVKVTGIREYMAKLKKP